MDQCIPRIRHASQALFQCIHAGQVMLECIPLIRPASQESMYAPYQACRPGYVTVYSPHQTGKSGISVCPLSGMQARLCYSVFPLIRLASRESVYAPYQACRPALDLCMPLIQHAGQAYNAPVYACYQDMLF